MSNDKVQEMMKEMMETNRKWEERQRLHEDNMIAEFDVTDRRWLMKDFTQEMFDEMPRPAQMAIVALANTQMHFQGVLNEIWEIAGSN